MVAYVESACRFEYLRQFQQVVALNRPSYSLYCGSVDSLASAWRDTGEYMGDVAVNRTRALSK